MPTPDASVASTSASLLLKWRSPKFCAILARVHANVAGFSASSVFRIPKDAVLAAEHPPHAVGESVKKVHVSQLSAQSIERIAGCQRRHANNCKRALSWIGQGGNETIQRNRGSNGHDTIEAGQNVLGATW